VKGWEIAGLTDFQVVKILTIWSDMVKYLALCRPRPIPNFLCRGHGVEDAGDDLRGASAGVLVGHFRFEEFGVRQNDPELIVEAMKQEAEVLRFVHRRPRTSRIGGRTHDMCLPVSWWVCPGSRQSVSTKMRTEPPAVRTYSTLLLSIQLYMVRRLTPTSSHAFMIEIVLRSVIMSFTPARFPGA